MPIATVPIAGSAGADPGTPVVFQALLRPRRTLNPAGFIVLMAAIAAISLVIGGFFLAIGAWPVFGLYGLDILLVYIAFRINYRRAQSYEAVRLTSERLTIERGDHRGVHQRITLEPHWLRVDLDDPVEHDSRIVLSSHGQSVTLAGQLAPAERAAFAAALRAALHRLRKGGGGPA